MGVVKNFHDSHYEKVVYVSHPYGGLKANEEKVASIILDLYKKYPTYLFISPIHAFSFEYTSCDYEIGINRCLWLLETCDECWVYGDYTRSRGCKEEIAHCGLIGLPCFIQSSTGNGSRRVQYGDQQISLFE